MLHRAILIISLISGVRSKVNGDYNCTYYVPEEDLFKYTPVSVACNNILSDAACNALYPDNGGYPKPNRHEDRPKKCYTTTDSASGPIDEGMKTAAINSCPKNCALCCMTPAYKCSNVAFPRLNCATITQSQCLSTQWRTIIAQDCPAACGFCNQNGCVDAVVDCENDLSICNAVGMQDFVNQYCQRSCARCPSTTAATSNSRSCTYIRDSSTACTGWADNGFCTNAFYTAAQRRAYCATTCRIC